MLYARSATPPSNRKRNASVVPSNTYGTRTTPTRLLHLSSTCSHAEQDGRDYPSDSMELNAHKTHLVGVLTLTSPFTITPQTYGLNFKFNLTGQGVQFVDTTGTADGVPDEFGSAPFSGTFEVLNQD